MEAVDLSNIRQNAPERICRMAQLSEYDGFRSRGTIHRPLTVERAGQLLTQLAF
jgi:hypothetical protein